MATADENLQFVQAEAREPQRVDLNRHRFPTVVAKFDVHGEVPQMKGVVEIGEKMGKRLLILVEEAFVGHVESVGCV